MIKFTIATCTFNAERDLPPTLQSVAQQDYAFVEHLLIDGASCDGSLKLLEDYKAANQGTHEIRIVSEPDKGLYDAMNKALRFAHGDYVLFLNAGDRLHAPNTLSMVALAANKEACLPGILYGNTDIVDEKGQFLHPRRLQPPAKLNWRSFRGGMLVCHQAFFAGTQLTKDIPYDLQYRFSADFDWCIRLMKEAEARSLPVTNANLVVADYLEGGMTTQNHRKSLMERFRIMSRYYGILQTVLLHIGFVLRNLK